MFSGKEIDLSNKENPIIDTYNYDHILIEYNTF